MYAVRMKNTQWTVYGLDHRSMKALGLKRWPKTHSRDGCFVILQGMAGHCWPQLL